MRALPPLSQVGSNAAYHILACSVAAGFAALAVQFELSDEALLDMPPGDAARWALTIIRSALYILSLATLLYAWRLILRGVQARAAQLARNIPPEAALRAHLPLPRASESVSRCPSVA